MLNWLPAIGASVLRRRAKRMYLEHIESAFRPFAKAWKNYYRAHCPIEEQFQSQYVE